MKILVTGGAGFIGCNFVYYMIDKHPDYDIVCLDALTYAGNLKSLNKAMENPKFKFVKGNIADRELVDKLFAEEKFDIVVNFAAESHVDRSIENPFIFLETNVTGTACLLDASRRHGVSRYHQVSTDEVYGDLPLDRPDLFFTETMNLVTSSPYSASKASADLLTLGEGLNVRDWLYVEDHCKAIDMVIQSGRVGEIYNVGGHNEKRNIDVVKTILAALSKPESLITHVKDRAGHDLRYAIDPTKISTELGWRPETSFDVGIAETIKWYLDNTEWMDEIKSGEYAEYSRRIYG